MSPSVKAYDEVQLQDGYPLTPMLDLCCWLLLILLLLLFFKFGYVKKIRNIIIKSGKNSVNYLKKFVK